jgi:hypothetical protein
VPTLFTFPHFSDINIFRNIQNVNDGGFGGSAAAFSGYPPQQAKPSSLWPGWLLFCSSDCALFALFCFTTNVIVCIPPTTSTILVFFLSFAPFLVGCWLSLIVPSVLVFLLCSCSIPRRHQPWPCSHSSAVSASYSSAASAVLLLSSSASVLLFGAPPWPFLGGAPARFLDGDLSAPHRPRLRVPCLQCWCASSVPGASVLLCMKPSACSSLVSFSVVIFVTQSMYCNLLTQLLHHFSFDSSISISTLPFPFRLFHFPSDSSISLPTLPLMLYYTTVQ